MAKKKIATKKTRRDELSFEESLAALEAIVGKLEGGRLELSDSLEQYEQGVRHLKSCYALLQDAEQRIALVSKVDARGEAQTAPFDQAEADEALPAKAAARGKRRSASDGPDGKGRGVDERSSLF